MEKTDGLKRVSFCRKFILFFTIFKSLFYVYFKLSQFLITTNWCLQKFNYKLILTIKHFFNLFLKHYN